VWIRGAEFERCTLHSRAYPTTDLNNLYGVFVVKIQIGTHVCWCVLDLKEMPVKQSKPPVKKKNTDLKKELSVSYIFVYINYATTIVLHQYNSDFPWSKSQV
jgi:hypothetical protein